MLVISAPALLQLQSAIVGSTHSLTKPDGSRALINTINDRALKQAALIAIQIAAGEVIWPGDETLTIDVPAQQAYGPFRIGRGQ
jgi:hypothetical protein